MAPEFFQGYDSPDLADYVTIRPTRASDIYSFAMVWYEASLVKISDNPACIDDVVSLKIFSGCIPFAGKMQFQITQAVSNGVRPKRPADLYLQARGLTDSVWEIMVACWDQLPEKRLSADQAVQRLRGLPALPTDSRSLDNYNMPSESWTAYKWARHPFAVLESITGQMDRELEGQDVGFPSIGPLTSPSLALLGTAE